MPLLKLVPDNTNIDFMRWRGFAILVSLALLAAFALGADVSLLLLALRRAQRRTVLPFGPFMLTGGLVAVLLG